LPKMPKLMEMLRSFIFNKIDRIPQF